MEVSFEFLEKLGKFDKQISHVIQSLRSEIENTMKDSERKSQLIATLTNEMVQKDELNMKLSMTICEKEEKITELEMKIRPKDPEPTSIAIQEVDTPAPMQDIPMPDTPAPMSDTSAPIPDAPIPDTPKPDTPTTEIEQPVVKRSFFCCCRQRPLQTK